MKIGLLARCDNRGIAYQTLEFYRHMQPHRTLVLMMNDRAWPEEPSRFNGRRVDFANINPDGSIEDRKIHRLLSDIDVLFAVETLMDWRIADMARAAGVRTVVQGNPELTGHHHPHGAGLAHPDRWVWPTWWMLDDLAAAGYPGDITDILPVPAPEARLLAADPESDDVPFTVLHVAGHMAIGDRNGTGEFMTSLEHIRHPTRVRVVGQDGWLPPANPSRHVELELITGGVADRWEMYRGVHLVVLPRHYGGLCLPAQEAMAAGCAIAMTDCSPNHTWPAYRLRARPGRMQRVKFGGIQTSMVAPRDIATAIDDLNRHRLTLGTLQWEADKWAIENSWTVLRDRYLAALS